jgi:hypothetical protein
MRVPRRFALRTQLRLQASIFSAKRRWQDRGYLSIVGPAAPKCKFDVAKLRSIPGAARNHRGEHANIPRENLRASSFASSKVTIPFPDAREIYSLSRP